MNMDRDSDFGENGGTTTEEEDVNEDLTERNETIDITNVRKS